MLGMLNITWLIAATATLISATPGSRNSHSGSSISMHSSATKSSSSTPTLSSHDAGSTHVHNSTTPAHNSSMAASDPNSKFPSVIPCEEGAGPFYGCGKCVNSSSIVPVDLSKATLEDFDTSSFAGDGSTGGGITWFSVPPFQPGCKVLFFTEGPGPSPPHGSPGYLAGIASNDGCYYINTGSKLSVSYCCGNDQCQSVSAGLLPDTSAARAKRRGDSTPKQLDLPPTRRTVPYTAEQKRQAPPPAVDYTFFTAPNTISGTSNWVPAVVPQQWCEPAVLLPGNDSTSTRAGVVQLFGNPQRCSSPGVCSHTIDMTFTSSGSVEISSSTESSSTQGLSVSYQFGYSAGPTELLTLGYDKSWTTAVTNSTGFTNTTSHTVGVTDTLSVMPGTWGQLALAPRLQCEKYSSKCHNGTEVGEIMSEICLPIMNSSLPDTPEYDEFTVTLG